jgi:hypothetical protein
MRYFIPPVKKTTTARARRIFVAAQPAENSCGIQSAQRYRTGATNPAFHAGREF